MQGTQQKTTRTVAFHQVLILTALYLFGGGGGGGGASLNKRVKKAIDDKARASQAREVADRIEDLLGSGRANLAKTSRGVTDIMEDHEAGTPELLPVFKRSDTEWARIEKRLVDLRFELKQHLTREEWNEVFADYVGMHL